MKVDLSCPLELWAFELPTKENSTCSFTFFNLGDRTISSIQVTVTCFDAADSVLSRRIERPMALDAKGRETFAVAISTEGMAVEAVDLIIDKAWFEDGSEWRRAQEARLTDYQPNELPPNRKLEQLRYVAGNDAVGYPSDQRNVWICVCGRVNAAEEKICKRCLRDKKDVFARFSAGAIQKSIDQRERELEEKARIAREEASRQEFLRQEKARRKKRNRRARSAIFCVTLVVGAATYLFIVLGLPELRYQSAKSALAAGDFTDARVTFVELVDYRDAEDLVKECDLRAAKAYAASGSEDRINEALGILDLLGEAYPGVPEARTEANYQKGTALMKSGRNADAAEIFSGLRGYQDADILRETAVYDAGVQEMNASQYESAKARFASLGLYKDAAALAKECVYRPATKLMADGGYEQAVVLLSEIKGYRDTSALLLEATYQSALQAQRSGDYDKAAERFKDLGSYEDASDQMKETTYLAATAAQKSGDWTNAAELFATFKNYKDSAEQYKLCYYTPAKALMDEKKYAEAAVLFLEVPGYEDADDLYKQCLYLPAMDAMKAKDYTTAIELLEPIKKYKDSEKQLGIAHYGQADQLEKDGDLEAAIEAFEALGEYEDAAKRVNAARYALAEKAFAEGLFSQAEEAFAMLGDYEDAADRVKECEYELALMMLPKENISESEDLQAVYDKLTAIEGYTQATEKAQEVAYAMGVRFVAEEDMTSATEAFTLAGKYKDADERRKECIYARAKVLYEDLDYQQAAEMFDSIADYSDARVLRDEAYDSWLLVKATVAYDLYMMEAYDLVVVTLEDLDMDTLPRVYAKLKDYYLEANLKQARKLIGENRALEAYKYLAECKGFKTADELLSKNIYRVLGTWESEMGNVFAFFFDGSCVIDGTAMRFNMFNAYGISVGETDDTLERKYSFANGTETSLTLREDATGKSIRLTRVREAEETQSENAFAGRPVVESVTKAGEGEEAAANGMEEGTEPGEDEAAATPTATARPKPAATPTPSATQVTGASATYIPTATPKAN